MIRLRLKMKSLIWVLSVCHNAYNVAEAICKTIFNKIHTASDILFLSQALGVIYRLQALSTTAGGLLVSYDSQHNLPTFRQTVSHGVVWGYILHTTYYDSRSES